MRDCSNRDPQLDPGSHYTRQKIGGQNFQLVEGGDCGVGHCQGSTRYSTVIHGGCFDFEISRSGINSCEVFENEEDIEDRTAIKGCQKEQKSYEAKYGKMKNLMNNSFHRIR